MDFVRFCDLKNKVNKNGQLTVIRNFPVHSSRDTGSSPAQA